VARAAGRLCARDGAAAGRRALTAPIPVLHMRPVVRAGPAARAAAPGEGEAASSGNSDTESDETGEARDAAAESGSSGKARAPPPVLTGHVSY